MALWLHSVSSQQEHIKKKKKKNPHHVISLEQPFLWNNKAGLPIMHEAAVEPVYLCSFQFI